MILAQMVLAHPLTEPSELALPPLAIATIVVSVVALATRQGERLTPSARASWPARADHLTPAGVAGRVLGVGLLLLAILAGRLGSESELDNVAPALVVGVGWPGLLLAAALVGNVWAAVDPFDGLARVMGARDARSEGGASAPRTDPPAAVWWAVPGALGWMAYLTVTLRPLQPRTVGAALAIYTIVTVAACLTVGRRRWLERGEVVTVFCGWVALVRRGDLATWTPPRGAPVLLGVLGGGLLFGALRTSALWGGLSFSPHAAWWAVAGLAATCAVVAAILVGLERWAAAAGSEGAVVAAAVPAVAALAVVAALARDRLFVSVQLLPAVLTDPFGAGWDPLGVAGRPLDPQPLGLAGLIVCQLAVLLGGHLAGAWVARRRSADRARAAVTTALSLLAAGGTLVVTAV